MKFDIRLATLDDAKYCADIHAESWNFAYSDIVPIEIINQHNAGWLLIWNKMLTNNIDSHYVILLDDVIIGFLVISVSRDDDLKESFYEIVSLYLSPNYIGLGFGKRTMNWIKREIQSRGYNNISLWVLQANNRAKGFYEKAFHFAEREMGADNIISAVMHADELNTALTEEYGKPIYHYHLHVIALPIVKKEVKWSKRCKDKSLVGTTKEIINQVSHSKKWKSEQLIDSFGNPVYDENGKAVGIDAVVISSQHAAEISQEQIHEDIRKYVIDPVIPQDMVNEDTKYFINPTGRFVIGGPNGDSGLTGRKIIVDTYGGWARHGGGAFSGKDCTKVDRSAAYAARYVAKNIVAAGLADKCEIQLSYAIGVAQPTSIMIDTFGTGKLSDEKLVDVVRENFDLRPAGIIKMLDLRRPIYKQTAAYGHFGRNDLDLPWEKTDKVDALKAYL